MQVSLKGELELAGLNPEESGGADDLNRKSPPPAEVMEKYDTNHDGVLDASEIAAMAGDVIVMVGGGS